MSGPTAILEVTATEIPSTTAAADPDVHALGSYAVGAVETDLGWIAVATLQGAVTCLTIGHASRENAIKGLRLAPEHGNDAHVQYDDITLVEALLPRFADYAAGVPDDFRDVPIHRPDLTPFGHRVMVQLRQVGYGQTVSYGELAERAGSPRAARAVGRVMATNLIPLILPCHRVVGSAGKLGGFSAPQGIDLKRRMLDLECRESLEPESL